MIVFLHRLIKAIGRLYLDCEQLLLFITDCRGHQESGIAQFLLRAVHRGLAARIAQFLILSLKQRNAASSLDFTYPKRCSV